MNDDLGAFQHGSSRLAPKAEMCRSESSASYDGLDQVPVPLAVLDGDLMVRFANSAYLALDLPGPGEIWQGQEGKDMAVAAATCLAASNDASMSGAVAQPVKLPEDPLSSIAWQLTPFHGQVRGGGGDPLLLSAVPLDPVRVDREARDINHRLKNTLQLISSLLTLHSLTSRSMELRHAFKVAGGRVGVVSQLHQDIGQLPKGVMVDIVPIVRDLCEEVGRSGPRISLTADTVELPVESVQPFALILYELLGNAATHAYALATPGDIEVALQRQDEGGLHLSVTDHGRGLPKNFDILRADSLGMKVIRAFASQLNGKIAAFDNWPGTRITLDLPA